MEKKVQKITTPIILTILVFLLMLLSTRIGIIHKQLEENFEYGLKTAGLLFVMEGLILLSGVVLVWIPYKKPNTQKMRQGVNPGLVLLFVVSMVFVIYKMLMRGFGLWSVDFLFTLVLPYRVLGQWVYYTSIPSLMAGFSLGSLLRQ
jgi:isoprenylcysteine carboxyl methyltransferase (ICMT) family protein YpbQ